MKEIIHLLPFLPLITLMVVITLMGLYWAIMTEQFLSLARRLNQKLHLGLDSFFTRPVFSPRAQANYLRLQANGGLLFFTWTVRFIGLSLVLFSLITLARIISIY
jgi:nitrogen fixation-related uncharacterized protein